MWNIKFSSLTRFTEIGFFKNVKNNQSEFITVVQMQI
jgi:hypothetical protein